MFDKAQIVIQKKRVLQFLDGLYGIVLGYGFTYFDEIKAPEQFVMLVLVYGMIIVDRLKTYRDYEESVLYSYSMFICDVVILFFFSRAMRGSVLPGIVPHMYWLALSLLFGVYLGWDFLSRQNNREKIGDIIGMVWFGCIYFPLFLRK